MLEPLPGSSLLRVACAASNDGEDGLMPVPLRLRLPPAGSGKFETPWLRMHSEKARKVCACDEPPGLWPDEPQAAIASAQTATASGIELPGRWRSLALPLARCVPRR